MEIILQDEIVKTVNENPEAGWKADMNPRFSDFTVSFLHCSMLFTYFWPT